MNVPQRMSRGTACAEHRPEAHKKWWIVRTRYERRDRRVLYWGPKGWGDLPGARIYSTADTRAHPLPFGGLWQEVELSQGPRNGPVDTDGPRLHLVPDVAGHA